LVILPIYSAHWIFLKAAVYWLCKGSIVICLLIVGLDEWDNVNFAFLKRIKKIFILDKRQEYFRGTIRPFKTLFSLIKT